jgi:xanthine dehydrogenase accessory factor
VKAGDVLQQAARLAAAGEPYVLATVVNVRRPASARRGDRAVVTRDGTLSGWVGGACSEPIVVREALRALADHEPRLVRIGPPGTTHETGEDVVVAQSACASEGVVEVLIEPQLGRPLLAIVGGGPAALTLGELARVIGWRVADELVAEADAVVVASMGHGDEVALRAALASGAGYVGLVASARRAASVLGALRDAGLGEDELARVRSPAGLDLGPSSQEEIAVAILAELVAWRHTSPTSLEELVEVVDPVCGMTVSVEAATETATHEGTTYVFCGAGCKARFESDPARWLPQKADAARESPD